MGIEDQIAFVGSLCDQIQAVLIKLRKPLDTFRSPGIHEWMHKHHVTRWQKTDWRFYTKAELQRAIGKLHMVLAAYQDKWRVLCEQAATEREERARARVRTKEECYTLQEAHDWIAARAASRKLVEVFTYEDTIDGVSYWRLRPQPVTLFTEREANAMYEAVLSRHGRPFDQCFEVTGEPGHDGTLYRPLFTTVAGGTTP